MSRAQPLSTTLSLIPVCASGVLFARPPNIPYVRTYVCATFPQPKKRKTLPSGSKKRERERERVDVEGNGVVLESSRPSLPPSCYAGPRVAGWPEFGGGGPREREHDVACSPVT